MDVPDECETCIWEDVYGGCTAQSAYLIISTPAITTALIGAVLVYAIFKSNLHIEPFYRNLLNYVVASSVRRVVLAMLRVFSQISAEKNTKSKINSEMWRCTYLGFVDNFLSSYELESLTHVCIERFINIWYTYNGREIPVWHNALFRWLSMGFAFFYAAVPLFGYGGYCKDFTCCSCMMGLKPPTDSTGELVYVTLHFLRNYKPLLFMFGMLTAAYYLHRKVCPKEMVCLTKATIKMTCVHVVLYLPFCIIKSLIVGSHIIKQKIDAKALADIIRIGITLDIYSSGMAMITFLVCDFPLLSRIIDLLFWRQRDEESPPIEEQTQETRTRREVKKKE